MLDIGLNGVLITEKQIQRTVTLVADPWVTPMNRSFFAIGKAESAGTAHSSAPMRADCCSRPEANRQRTEELRRAQST